MKKIDLKFFVTVLMGLTLSTNFVVSQAPGNNCADAVDLPMPVAAGDVVSTGLQSTCALTNDFGNANYCNNIDVLGSGRDGVYRINVTTSRRYIFRLTDGSNRKTLSIHSACAPAPSNCVAAFQTGNSTTGEVSVELNPGVYYLIIDRQDECCGFLCLGSCNACRDFNLEIEVYDGNGFCNEADPFCSDSPITFPAGVNTGTAEPGPNYGCLSQRPNPAWYYLEIDEAGDIVIDIIPSPLRDIDFAIWGPFTDVESSCVAELTATCGSCPSNTSGSSNYPYGNLVDCSYDPQAIERATIPNAQVGETYIMLVTNFSNQATNISINQVGGSGSTDCSIVIPCQVQVDAGAGGEICLGENIQLEGSYSNPEGNTTYEWISTPADAINDLDATDILNPTFTPSFAYGEVTFILSVTDDGPTDPCTVGDIVVVIVNDLPSEPVVTSNNPICSGENAIFDIQGNPDNTITYSLDGGTTFQTVQLDEDGIGQVIVSDASLDQTIVITEVTNDTCSIDGLSISTTVTVNPLPINPTITVNSPVCQGETVGFTISGDANLTVVYTLDGGANEETITLDGGGEFVVEIVAIQASTTLTIVSVSDGTCTVEPDDLHQEVIVNPLPTVTVNFTSPICPNEDAVFEIVGEEGLEVVYSIDGGITQNSVVLDATGSFDLVVPNVLESVVLEISSLDNGNCQLSVEEEYIIEVNELPNAPIISSNAPVCEGEEVVIVLEGSPELTVVYTIDGGVQETVELDINGTGQILIANAEESFVVEVVSISFGDCSVDIENVTEGVVVFQNPSAPIITSNSPVCEGERAVFTIQGEEGSIVSYSFDGGGTVEELTIGASGTEEIEITNLSQDETLLISNVANENCNITLSIQETVLVLDVPAIPVINSNSPVCVGEELIVSISGDAGLEIVYEMNNEEFSTLIPASGVYIIEETSALESFEITLLSVSNSNCEIEINHTESIIVNDLPQAVFIVAGGDYCDYEVPNSITLALSGEAPWEVTYLYNGIEEVVTSTNPIIEIGSTEGVYIVNFISDLNCAQALELSTEITIKPSPDQPVVPSFVSYCLGDEVLPIEVENPEGQMEWYTDEDLTDFIGVSSAYTPEEIEGTTIYYVIANLDNCESFSSEVEVVFELCDLDFPTAITPNGDGMNDVWELNNLDQLYPNNSVKIFTRWGDLIFDHDSSKNGPYSKSPWDGTYKGNVLPVGSYLFIIEFNDEGKNVINGSVTILLE